MHLRKSFFCRGADLQKSKLSCRKRRCKHLAQFCRSSRKPVERALPQNFKRSGFRHFLRQKFFLPPTVPPFAARCSSSKPPIAFFAAFAALCVAFASAVCALQHAERHRCLSSQISASRQGRSARLYQGLQPWVPSFKSFINSSACASTVRLLRQRHIFVQKCRGSFFRRGQGTCLHTAP